MMHTSFTILSIMSIMSIWSIMSITQKVRAAVSVRFHHHVEELSFLTSIRMRLSSSSSDKGATFSAMVQIQRSARVLFFVTFL